MPRISVVEQYDNKDLIQQIYRLKDLVETGTASNIAVTDNHDGTITVDVTMRDGTIQTFTLANDNIATIGAVQSGADVTVTVTFESGSTQSFTFNVASGKVDVLTTAGSYVYTHTGATQNEQQYAINAVAGSIMQRDASGQTEINSPASDVDSDYVVNMTKLNARLTDGSVTKVGTSNVGSDTKPIKLVAGVPTAVTNDLVDLPSAQAITGTKTVPLETTGVFSDQIASSNKVKNELDSYTPMLRTTGNQVAAGLKEFNGGINNSVIVSSMNKAPENVSGKCLKVMHIPTPHNVTMIYRISGGMNAILTGMFDIRTANVSMNVINKIGSDTGIDETACMIAVNADNTKDVFIKYRANRRFNITIEKMYDTHTSVEYTDTSNYIDYSSTLVDYPVADGVNILSVNTSIPM